MGGAERETDIRERMEVVEKGGVQMGMINTNNSRNNKCKSKIEWEFFTQNYRLILNVSKVMLKMQIFNMTCVI